MKNAGHKFGQKSETIAARYLEQKGYKIITQNYRTKLGEIDIIAKEKDTIVFVEVKARRSWRFGNPKGALTPKKQRKISMVALCYLKANQQTRAKARFDVVTIHNPNDTLEIEVIKNAFDLAYP